jgi:iron(III) transport system permease protein
MKKSRDDYLTLFFISIIGFYIFIALAFPMYAILSKSFENKDGAFIGFENYQSYFENSSLVYSIYNSLFISIVTMVITYFFSFCFCLCPH